jgi:hypothetical protein
MILFTITWLSRARFFLQNKRINQTKNLFRCLTSLSELIRVSALGSIKKEEVEIISRLDS